MKSVICVFLISACEVLLPSCSRTSDQQEPTTLVDAVTNSKPKEVKTDKRIVDFLTSLAETRIMNTTLGELAQQRSSTHELREYGALMIEDQSKISADIKALVKVKNVVIPEFIDLNFSKELSELKDKKGKDFNSTFITIVKRNHERDVRELREAVNYDDADIKIFALHYLPLIENHLRQIEEIDADK